MLRRYYTSVTKYERAKKSKTVYKIEIIKNNEDSGEDGRVYIRFQLWHRSFDSLYIPFTFRFAAALLSIFRYLKPAGGCDWRLNVSIDCLFSSQINMSTIAH